MSGLKLFLLGSPRIERDGVPLKFETRKNVALIAYLALTGDTHTREALTTLLWPELEPSRARAVLRRNLSKLKKSLTGEWLVVDRETVGLSAAPWLDVDQFQALLQSCQEHGHPQARVCPDCLSALAEAVELYRGDFMAGFSLRDSANFDEWQFFQTEGLRQELALALEALAHGHGAQGEHQAAIPYARRWLALDPLHESAQRCLMRLYAWSGQRAAALRQYAECERVLEEELGAPPEEETTQLYQAIKQRREPALPEARIIAPVSPQADACRRNLPIYLTPFIGRETILAEIRERLDDPACRLLTLVGPGGSGKTRLAVEAGAAQAVAFEHGVHFVRLSPLQSVDAIVPTVAQVLGFSFYQGRKPRQQLLDYVRQKSMLLIMDNFEHLLACPKNSRGNGVTLVTDILKTAPDVSVLATSRARLNVQGEQLFPVAGMGVPDKDMPKDAVQSTRFTQDATQYSAVKLFLSSARQVQPDFELTSDNLADVAQICQLVQGMPLGILLAAGWVEMLTPAEIAAEISQSLDFLETDLRDVPERQHSMRAVFDHSWRTLTEREREVFQGLSVFRGGFTREAAQAVSGASLHELMALVHKSLLHRTPTPSTPSTALRTGGRYEVHELLRQYAADKLRRADKLDQTPSEGQAVRDRHSAFYATALQEWEDDLKGPRQQTALAEMDAEIENARAAWDWAAEWGQVERLDQALEGLCLFYSRRMRFQEGEEMCRLAARKLETAAKGGELQLLVKLLAEQSYFNFELGHKEFTNQLLRKSLALLERPELAGQDTRWEKAYVLRRMAQASIPDFEKARRLYEQSLALYQALGDRWWTANALISLGSVVGYLDMYGKAQQLLEQSLEIRQALGDSLGIARSLLFLGVNALQQGQLERAERLAREGYAISQKAGDWAKNMSLSTLGQTLSWCGKFAEAQALLQENLTIWNDQGDRAMLAWSNTLLGSIEVLYLGRYEQARALIQKGIALARKVDAQVRVGVSLHWLGCVALAREKYAEAQQLFQESVVIYRELGLRADLGEALGGLGIALRGLGYLPQAEQHLSEALRTAVEIGAFRPLMYVIPAMALLLADAGGSARGEKEQAVELYALASRYRYVANSRWFEDVVGKHITAVAVNLPPEVVAAAQERGRARDLWATAAELLAELEREHTPPETT